MPKFMLLFAETPGERIEMSPEEMQAMIAQFQSWLSGVKQRGDYLHSEKLMDEGGKVITRPAGSPSVVDGPYSEAKEVIGGYVMFRAANYDEAVAIACDCPLSCVGKMIVRQTDPMGCGEE